MELKGYDLVRRKAKETAMIILNGIERPSSTLVIAWNIKAPIILNGIERPAHLVRPACLPSLDNP